MPDWFIPIEGFPGVDKGILAAFGLEITTATDGTRLISGPVLTGLNDRDEASLAATELLDALNGYIQLHWPGMPPAGFTWLLSRDAMGNEQRFITAVPKLFVMNPPYGGDSMPLWEYAPPTAGYQALVPRTIVRPLQRPEVVRALSIHGRGLGLWWALYATYEIIRNDVGGFEKIVERGWATTELLDRFREGANHPKVAGVYSRHGVRNDEPTLEPLRLDEARRLIRRILVSWIIEDLDGAP